MHLKMCDDAIAENDMSGSGWHSLFACFIGTNDHSRLVIFESVNPKKYEKKPSGRKNAKKVVGSIA